MRLFLKLAFLFVILSAQAAVAFPRWQTPTVIIEPNYPNSFLALPPAHLDMYPRWSLSMTPEGYFAYTAGNGARPVIQGGMIITSPVRYWHDGVPYVAAPAK